MQCEDLCIGLYRLHFNFFFKLVLSAEMNPSMNMIMIFQRTTHKVTNTNSNTSNTIHVELTL